MISKKKKSLEETYERIINVGFCIIPYEDLSDIIGPDPMVFGTTKDERIFSFEGVDALFKSQFEQMGNMEPGLDRKRLATQISADENNAFIVEEITLTISSPEEVNTIFMRVSCVMEYMDGRWKLTHWHTSTPVDTENDPWHMEEWKREKEKLQQLVDQQTADLQLKNRELEIEAAIERVRARAMAMQESDELAEVSSLLFQQMEVLGVSTYSSGFTIWDEDQDELISWMCNADGSMNPPFRMPLAENRWHNAQYEYWKNGKDLAVKDFTGEEMQLYFRYLRSFPLLDEAFKKSIAAGHPMPERQVHHVANFSHGNLLFITLEPCPEAHELFKRFAKVFEQTYTRFLDLKKAEAQARESEIQLALESVRARTMAMHNSEELGEVAAVMFEQISSLTSTPDRFNICIANEEDESFDVFVTDQSGYKIKNTFNAKAKNSPVIAECFKTWKNDAAHLIQDIHGKKLENWIRYMGEVVGIPFKMENVKKHRFLSSVFFSHGFIGITTHSQPQETTINLIERFAKVFQQTYTRFLDLKKAEAQAREAEIQLALERVRAKSMAMHKSDELADLSLELVKQVHALGIDTWFCAFNIYDDHPEGSIEWGSNGQGTFPRYRTPREGVFLDYYEAGQRGETLLINEIGEDECPAHYDYLCSLPGVGEQLLQMKDTGIPFPTSQIDHAAFFKYGYILFITFEPVPEAHDIFKRFAKVFQQTYTRFLDLQKSEEQAREAKIEAALERVRARSMGMHKSDDLIDVVREIGKGIHELGIQLHYSQIFTDYTHDPKTGINIWVDAEEQEYLEKFHLPYIDHFITQKFYNPLNEGLEFFGNQFSKSDKDSFFELLFEHSDLKKIPRERKELILDAPGWTRFTVVLDGSSLNFGRYNLDKFTREDKDIFKRFGKVFGQAYTRFLDLHKAEEQAREAQIEAALERVRARSMGMHKSDDLIDVVREIGKGIHELGIQLHYSQIYTDYTYDPKTGLNIWVDVEGQDYLEKFHLPYIDHTITLNFLNALNEGLDYFSDRYSKAEKDTYFKLLFKYSDLKRIPKKRKELILNASGWTRFTVILNEAALNFGRYSLDEFTDEEHEIFIRFAKVFGQAYTRFLDLQKAEEQAKEAQVEAALERVRAQAMAMHHTEDLGKTIEVYFEQLDSLIDSIIVRCGAGLLNKENRIAEMSTASRSADGEVYSVNGVIDMRGHPLLDSTYEHWLMQKEHSYVLRGNEIREYYQYITNQVAVPDNAGTDELHFHFPMFTEGSFYVVAERELPEDELNIFRRFSSVLSLTYRRFNDLKKAEAQAREAEIETALERVRSRSLAMQKSDDLHQVINIVSEQLIALEIEFDSANFIEINEDGSFELWVAVTGQEYDPKIHVPYIDNPIMNELLEAKNQGVDLFQGVFSFEDKNEFFTHIFENTAGKNAPEERKQFVFECEAHTISSFTSKSPALTIGNYRDEPFSEKENEIFRRFANVFEQAYTRFLDLQKAEAQAREAEIEASLERVRAKAMAMHSSKDIESATVVVFNELSRLGIEMERCGITLLNETPIGEIWSTPLSQESKEVVNIVTGYLDFGIHPMLQQSYEDWIEKKEFCTYKLVGDEVKKYYAKLEKQPEYKFPKVDNYPDQQILNTFYFNEGGIFAFTVEELSAESKDIIQKFTKVFAQTYTRFLDLQKAEAQAREAQIEMALEKVRSRTMAMQSSDELTEAASEMFSQIEGLGLNPWSCGFNIFNDDKTVISQWVSTGDGRPIEPFDTPATEGIFKRIVEQSENDEPLYIEKMEGKKLEDTYKYMASLPTLDKIFEELDAAGIELPKKQVDHAAYFKHGYLMFITYEETPEFHTIFKRFAKVFEQTYTRFLDLQKAEAQAREAKIETALEKVRSRTMGMQSSEELPGVANLMFLEVQALGIPAWSCGYCILLDDGKSSTCIMSSEGTLQKPFLLPHSGEASFIEWDEFVHSDETFFTQELGGKAIESHYNFMKSLPQLTPIFREIEEAGLSLPTYQINHLCKITHGFLLFITYEPVPDAHDIFKRFTNVFEQTYTRFLDLKKAEKLAIETARQSSLDRIRAEIGSMRSAEDLKQITPIIWDELKTLEIPFIRCGVFIIDEENEVSHTYLSTSQGDPIAALHLPFEDIPLVKNAVSSWKESKIYTEHWDQQDFSEWTQNLIDRGFIDSKKKYEAGSAPETLDLHFLPFKHGMLYIGNTEPLSKKSLDLGQSMAKAFSVAYDRYEDFNKLEQAKQKIEEAFKELEAAKDQLVQQEKLASLGQLTAGIAHEIKNPLNFVNNFSDLNIELVEEMRHEIRDLRRETDSPLSKGDKGGCSSLKKQEVPDEAQTPSLILEILNDIEANLRKIHEHGTRADSIVKSMLQHSRGGDGKMEPTALNPLIKEYVNLAFHGMRAGKDPINVDIDLQLDENVGEVPLVAEDFSRVILNLVNNGFDAMREKLTGDGRPGTEENSLRPLTEGKDGEAGQGDGSPSKYEPKLTVRTHRNDQSVTIEIEDNGPGIPDEIKDKIMQPFFTTKKGTAGTGLGLSITNDIVKAHGGELSVNSTSGSGSTFIITLKP